MKNSRFLSLFLLVVLLTPFFTSPLAFLPTTPISFTTVTTENPNFFKDSLAMTLPPNTIRVAIYNEPNLTIPSYVTSFPDVNNNVTQFAAMLNGYGFQTTLLDVHAIYDNALMTANFDVLALVDNYPRENITDQVENFWLAGGSLLVMDGSAEYLCYRGILPPESAGSSGQGVYWFYGSNDFTVYTRHPVSKSYALTDNIDADNFYNYFYWDWLTMSGSSIGSDITRVARTDADPDGASVLAFDPQDRGGRIVTFAYDFAHEALPSVHPMIRDAVHWLCPRPKARIVIDFTHNPYFKVDSYDIGAGGSLFTQFRNTLVNHSYTVDKLMPSPMGNLINSRLAPYDVLICIVPNTGFNYTASEVTAVTSFVQDGGALLVIGERYSWNPTRVGYLNYLLSNLHIQIATPDAPDSLQDASVSHPTREGVTDLYTPAVGTLNFTGTGYGLWGPDVLNFAIGASEPGNGRVIVASDINFLENTYISDNDNHQFGINAINWLANGEANVLLMVDYYGWNPDAYSTPVVDALNELGLSYYLTFSMVYFNLSLNSKAWDFVIIDQPYWEYWDTYLDDINAFLDTSGRLLMSGFRVDSTPTHPLWARMGFGFDSEAPSSAILYLWDSGHEIFNQPVNYNAANFTPSVDFGDEGDSLTVFSNASALAGFTASATPAEASIIVRNDMRTLYNGYLIDQLQGDTDDSTYADNLELWINEIAFMAAPRCVFTPNVPTSYIQGFPVTLSIDIINNGLSPAIGGEVAINIPGALGTLTEPATQPFTLDPGDSTTITWHSSTIGVDNHTITFVGTYHGLPMTSYSSGLITRYLNITAGIPFPLPWWWWIAAIGVIVLIVIIILVICLRRRSSSK